MTSSLSFRDVVIVVALPSLSSSRLESVANLAQGTRSSSDKPMTSATGLPDAAAKAFRRDAKIFMEMYMEQAPLPASRFRLHRNASKATGDPTKLGADRPDNKHHWGKKTASRLKRIWDNDTAWPFESIGSSSPWEPWPDLDAILA